MNKWTVILILIIAIGGLFFLASLPDKPGQYDKLAQSIAQSGTKFYGAFWCSNCQTQKAEFGKSAKLLPYIECSTPDTKGQLQVCKDQGITAYPTWVFADGSRRTGVISREELTELIKIQIATSTVEVIN